MAEPAARGRGGAADGNQPERGSIRTRVLRPALLGTVLVALALFAGHEFVPTALGTQELSKMCVNKASGRVRFVTSTAQCNTKTETGAVLPGTGPITLCAATTDGSVRKVATAGSCTGGEVALSVPQTGPTFFCYKPTTGSFLRRVTGAGSCAGDEWVAVVSVPVAVNDARSVNEDGSLTALTVLGNDTDAHSDPMTTALVAATGPTQAASFTFNPDGTFSYTPAVDFFGSDSFQYTATDGTYTSLPATVTITVNPVNDAPAFALGADQSVALDAGPQTVTGFATGMSPGPANESAQTLNFTTTNDNNALFSTQPSVSAAGDLTYQSATGATGSALVTVSLQDSGGVLNGGVDTTSHTFTITVGSTNQAPTADADSYTVNEDSTLNQPAAGGVLDGDTDPDTDAITAVLATGPAHASSFTLNADGSFAYTPVANYCGSDSFTYKAQDVHGAQSSPAQVTITVTCLNDAPTFTPGGNQTVAEDAGAQTATGWAGAISPGPGETGQTPLTFNVTNDNNALFSTQPAVSATTGNLTYTPAANASGSATVTVTLTDSGIPPATSSPAQTFTITVAPVNDRPTFTAGSNQTAAEDAGLQTVPNWPQAISPGPGETGQTPFTFNVSNNNNGLFSTQPAIASNGTLTYTPAANATGVATVTVTLTDSGTPPATSSPAQTFTITVTAVNDAPVNALPSAPNVNEDAVLTLSGGGAIAISDIDAGTNPVRVALTAANGTMTLNGTSGLAFTLGDGTADTAMTFTGTVSAINTALGGMTFTPTPNFAGSASIQVVTNDQGNTGAGGAQSDTDPLNITVNAVDDPPVNTVPGAQTVNEDTDLTFTGATAIAIADIDAGASAVKVSLDATSGTITLPSTVGLTLVDGTTNGSASVHVTGTVSAVNTALNGMKFKGTLNYNSTRAPAAGLSVTTNDQGNTGSGGPLTDTDTIAITVNAVNDPPVAAPFSFTVQTNMKRTSISNLLTGATDPDTGDGGYTFTPTVESGSISATSPAGGTISNVNLTAGSFDFDPPPGVTGPVTFTFRICDTGNPGPAACSVNATATATVSGAVIWFVNPAVVGPGDGRLSNPFKQLSGAAAVDASGHSIFVYSGTVNTGIVLNPNEKLIGQGVTGTTFDVLFGVAPPANTIARPSLGGTRPTVQGNIDMDTNDQVRGLNIQVTGTTQGLSASSATGLTVAEVSVTSATGIALNLVNADGTFRPDSVSSTGAPSGIVWNNTTVATGLLEVLGNAAGSQNSTGGTITGSTGPSVRLHNTRNVVLWSLSITNPANLAGTHGILATEMTGSNDFRGIVVSGVADNQSSSMDISNTTQPLTGLTIRGSKITSSNSTRTALLVQNKGNQSMAVGVNTTELSALFPVAAQFASGQNAGTSGPLTVTFTDNQLLNAPASGANSVNFVGINSSTLNVTATGNTATNVGKPVASVGVFSVSAQDTASVNAKINGNAISSINGYQAVNLAAENNATTLKVQVDNNDINGLQSSGITLNVNTNAQNTNVSITNNRIGNVTPVGTNSGAMGILIQSSTTGGTVAKTANVLVSGNTVVNNNGGLGETFQMLLSGSGAASTTLNLTVTNNSFDNLSGTVHSGYLEAAESLGAVCLDITGNNSNGQPIDVAKNGQPFTIRNRDSVVANNPLASFVFSPNLAAFGTQSGACPQPTLPPI